MLNKLFATSLLVLAATVANAGSIDLQDLGCINQQEVGFDEIEVVVRADGVVQDSFTRSMKRGDKLMINRTYYFNQSVTVEVTERDAGTDDRLGTVTITSGPGSEKIFGGKVAKFEYELNWN